MTTNGTNPNSEHYVINMTTGVATQILVGWVPPNGDPQLAGAAADDANRILYFSSNPTSPTLQDVIYAWPYGSAMDPQVVVVNPVTAGGAAVDCSGLAFANGQLYALNQYGGTQDGIYAIDTLTGIATLAYAFLAPYDIGGIDFNPADGKFYGTNDAVANQGIIAFDIVAQTETFVASYPPGIADVDGCAVDPNGAGTVYLIEDNPAPLHAYSLATGTYATMPRQNPVTGTYTYSGGAWADSYFGPAGIGSTYCGPAVSNTTGSPAALTATGSNVALGNDVTLVAASVPANQFGFFLTSQTQGLVANPGGSQGNLCLGGTIGRYVGAGQIQNAGAGGTFSLALDLNATPAGPVFVAITAGQSWNFQAWFRDTGPAGQPWSNFTDGRTILFQ